MNPNPAEHKPVLLRALLLAVDPQPGQCWIDGTFGRGGHTRAFLERGCRVLGLDRDASAAPAAAQLWAQYPQTFTFERSNFNEMQLIAHNIGWKKIDGVLLDLGVSSPQLDNAQRGFSFRADAPLDMRMDQDQSLTAAQLVNTLSETDLADLIYHLGDERDSRRIARAIVQRRETMVLATTTELAEIVSAALPHRRHGRVHPATKVFQALRIAVNAENEALAETLPQAANLLQLGGVLAVISFHSGEDRAVKNFFRERWRPTTEEAVYPIIFSKVARHLPDEEEIAANPRSRSARLRLGWKKEESA
jgi:16S rRNA (cytosine1402-N4)-methyltransferase